MFRLGDKVVPNKNDKDDPVMNISVHELRQLYEGGGRQQLEIVNVITDTTFDGDGGLYSVAVMGTGKKIQCFGKRLIAGVPEYKFDEELFRV